MSSDWAERIAQLFLSRGLVQPGICLILGAADTGKTTLTAALAKHAASSGPVGIIDADIGQSHIGPPTTVGWAVVDEPNVDFSELAVSGLSFVGDITPTGHLLQLTAAVTQCVRQASEVTNLVIIDTPGFVYGPAAAALWWTVQRILQPDRILAVQRDLRHNKKCIGAQCDDELSDILTGLNSFETHIELIGSPPGIPLKNPQDRRRYRQSQFNKYFRDSRLCNISLTDVAVQPGRNLKPVSFVGRLVGLRDKNGADLAVGLVTQWENDKNIAVIRTPEMDVQQIRCLVIGDVSIEVPDK